MDKIIRLDYYNDREKEYILYSILKQCYLRDKYPKWIILKPIKRFNKKFNKIYSADTRFDANDKLISLGYLKKDVVLSITDTGKFIYKRGWVFNDEYKLRKREIYIRIFIALLGIFGGAFVTYLMSSFACN